MEKKITKSVIKKAVGKCFDVSDIVKIKEYSSGYINKSYEIRLKGKKELILRVYNEKWKAQKEFFIYRDIKAHLDIPVPKIYCVDDSRKVMPNAFALMSKLPGMQIDIAYKKYKNKRLFEQAGEILAKLHSIKFPKYGWIVGKSIKPAFKSWREFVWHDIEIKLSHLKKVKKVMNLVGDVEHYLEQNDDLLNIKKQPCLLHKDYHCSHILANKDEVTGIIDVEWAIAGHNENDFMKIELWDFAKMKDLRSAFFRGYLKHGSISKEYKERKKLYELYHWVSMVNISYELGKKDWLKKNINCLERCVK
jgi:fructosamine-3-kinase